MTFEIELDADDLARGLRELEGELERELIHALDVSAGLVEREGKVLVPKVSEALKDSIQALPAHSAGANLEAEIIADAPHALSIHDGSRPHIIRARRAGVLAWPAAGGMRFATWVNHPGTRPYPFLEMALELRAPDIESALDNAYAAAFERTGFGG